MLKREAWQLKKKKAQEFHKWRKWKNSVRGWSRKKHTFGKCLRCNADQVNVVSSEIQTVARVEKKKRKGLTFNLIRGVKKRVTERKNKEGSRLRRRRVRSVSSWWETHCNYWLNTQEPETGKKWRWKVLKPSEDEGPKREFEDDLLCLDLSSFMVLKPVS